ncbi:hypothetical protein BDZ94DRAFT_1240666 [Collybia nuda]|uniref:DUF6533 domain-containing protein n=1 Tax=Collybia nuda TaxID=64659 RepID=A0A9P5XXP7_9AGAR|nr:hypothetical protein BDZ94DRAFT_1240666 [Collybia nuda]
MSNSLNIALLNAFPTMVISPQEQAYQKSITEYVIVGGLSVLIWDILTHLQADYKLFVRHRVNFPTWIYLLSRWSTLLYGIVCAVFITAPVEDCAALARIKCAVYHVTISSTALLFFLRVRAIFNQNRQITVVFLILWLAVVGGSMTAVISISGTHLGDTPYCVFADVKSYLTATANISLALFDTSVFIAITWRLSTSHLTDKRDAFRGGKADFFGTYLPAFSKALLQDGQKYYMVAMVANLLVLIMEFVPGVPPSYRAIFLAPAIELTNIMACRVFRHTKKRRDDDVVHEASTMKFGKNNNVSVYIHTQVGRLTTTSVTESGNHGSSITETELESKERSKSSRASKEFISAV